MEQSPLNLSVQAAVILGACIIAASILIVGFKGSGTFVAGTAAPGQTAQAGAPDSSKVATEGEPFIGKADAPLTIAYWSDYQCPFCRQNEEEAMPQLIKDYVDTGKAKLVFKDFQFLGPDSQTLGQFGRAVWAAAPDKFYAWHKAVYDNQGTENTGWATHDKILSITTNVLGAATASKVDALVKANGAAYQKAIDADKAEGAAFGVNGTPAMLVGTQVVSGAVGYPQIQSAIEAALR